MHTLISITAMAALLATVSGAATAQERVLDPSGEWKLSQQDEYCLATNSFGAGEDTVGLYLYQYGPGKAYQVVVAGSGIPRNDGKAELVRISLSETQEPQQTPIVVSQARGRGMISFQLIGQGGFTRFGRSWSGRGIEQYDVRLPSFADRISIAGGDLQPVTLHAGDLSPTMTQLEDCARKLADAWYPQVTSLGEPARGPELLNGMEVIDRIKWPPALLLNRVSLMLQIRMVVGADGRAEDCWIQTPSMRDKDRRLICSAFEGLGRFTPARDATGNDRDAVFRTTAIMFVFD